MRGVEREEEKKGPCHSDEGLHASARSPMMYPYLII